MSYSITYPHFFVENNHPVTVNKARFIDMLKTFVFPKLEKWMFTRIWFQQNSLTVHILNETLNCLYIREHRVCELVREHDVSVISMGFANC